MKKILSGLTKGMKYLLFQVIIPNLIWIIILGVPSALVGLWIWWEMIKALLEDKGINSIYIVLMICFAAICILTLAFSAVYFFTQRSRLPHLKSNYKVTKCEYELYFKDREHIEQRQYVDLISLDDELKHFEHVMTWSGEKYIRSMLSEGQDRGIKLTDTRRTSSPYRIMIDFPRAIRYNSPESYGFRSEFEDGNHSMLPYLGKTIKVPTESLVLRITSPVGMLSDVYKYVSTGYQGDPDMEPPKRLDSRIVGEYELFEATWSELNLLHRYGIRWEFCNP